MPFNVTSSDKIISKFINDAGNKIIFCTYQSLHLIQKVQKNKKIPNFELIIADEAHKVASPRTKDNYFSFVLDSNKIRRNRILFCTATPRTLSPISRKLLKIKVSMFQEWKIRNYLANLSIHYLFQKPLIIGQNPFLHLTKLIVMGVNEKEISHKIIERELVKNDKGDVNTDAESLAILIGTLKLLKKYNISKLISFHSRVKNAKKFSEEILSLQKILMIKVFQKMNFSLIMLRNENDNFRKIFKIKKIRNDS